MRYLDIETQYRCSRTLGSMNTPDDAPKRKNTPLSGPGRTKSPNVASSSRNIFPGAIARTTMPRGVPACMITTHGTLAYTNTPRGTSILWTRYWCSETLYSHLGTRYRSSQAR